MKPSLLILALVLGATACAQSNVDNSREKTSQGYSRQVTYIDSVVYSGATHYFFRDEKGFEFKVIESNDPGSLEIDNIEFLLDPNPIEGPPGANPEMLGRKVILYYNEQMHVERISIVTQ